MDNLTSVKKIISRLKPEEIKVFRQYVNMFERGVGNTNKSNKLFELLNKLKHDHTKSSYNQIVIDLGYGKRVKTFEKLLLRLRDKIYECLLFDVNIQRISSYNKSTQAIVDIRKKTILAQILQGRGLGNEALKIYDQVITKASKYEIFQDLVVALYQKRNAVGYFYGKKEYQKLTETIELYERKRDAFEKIRSMYFYILSINEFATISDKESQSILEDLKLFEHDYRYLKSATIGFFYLSTKVELFNVLGDYNSSNRTSFELIDLLTNNKFLNLKIRLGFTYLNLANSFLMLGEFDNSLNYALKAQDRFSLNSSNYLLSKEIQCYCHIYLNKISDAKTLIQDIVKNELNPSSFLKSKRDFIAANLDFINSDFKEVIQILNSITEIEKDKEGYNIGSRVLLIITNIELSRFDVADLLIENLRKYMQRQKRVEIKNLRSKLIVKILIDLSKRSYDFADTYYKRNKDLELLASSNTSYAWKIKSNEIINFNYWFLARMNKTKYKFNLK